MRYGIFDPPYLQVTPFQQISSRPPAWTSEEQEFAEGIISKRLEERVWKELSKEDALSLPYISTEFIAHVNNGKVRAVAGLHHFSSHWHPQHKKVSTLESFAAQFMKRDRMIAFDLQVGYNHFRLHPAISVYFTVKFGTRYFQYIALPFGWRRSGVWFVRLTSRLWTYLRKRYGWRILDHIDDILVCPNGGKRSKARDCRRATDIIRQLMSRYGLRIHPDKGVLGNGTYRLEHLGLVIDTARMTFSVPEHKVMKVERAAKYLMNLVRRNRRQVEVKRLKSFAGGVPEFGPCCTGHDTSDQFTK